MSESVFGFPYKVLTYLGFWGTESKNPTVRAIYLVYQSWVLFYLLIFVTFLFWDLTSVWTDVHKASTNLSATMTAVMLFWKNIQGLQKLPLVRDLQSDLHRGLHRLTDEKDTKILQRAALEMKVTVLLVYMLGLTTMTGWLIAGLLLTDRNEEENLPLPVWIPWQHHKSPFYELSVLYQGYGGFFITFDVLSLNLSIFGTIVQICAEYDILLKNTENINEWYEKLCTRGKSGKYVRNLTKEENLVVEEMIVRNIQHHQKIIHCAGEAENCYVHMMLVQFGGSALLITVVFLDLILVSREVNFRLYPLMVFLVLVISDIYLFCNYGSRLDNKSDQFLQRMYGVPWEVMNNKNKRMVLIMIMKAQRPPKLTVEKFANIDLYTLLRFSVGLSRKHTWKMSWVRDLLKDPIRIYKFNYWFYVCTGCWRYDTSVRWKRNLFEIYEIFVAIFYIILVVLFFIDAVSVRHDLDKLSFNMTSSVLVFLTVLKVMLIRRQKDKVEGVLKSLDNHVDLKTVGIEDKEILGKRAQLILSLTRLLYSLLVVCYAIRVVSDTALDTRAYLVPMPYKEHLEDHYGIIYTLQVILVSHFVVAVIAHDLFNYGMINRFLAHFEVLEKNFLLIKTVLPQINFEKYVRGYTEQKSAVTDVLLRRDRLEEIKDLYERYKSSKMYEEERVNFGEERARQLLTESIAHHQKLLMNIRSFCQVYSQPFIVQVIGTILLLGIVAVKILFLSNQITALLVQQVIYVGITLVNNLYLCSFGSELSTKSVAAANALYDTPWYEMSLKNRKMLNFTLKNLMEVPKMRAGSLVVIDRITYLTMLQTSYNMVVVLRNVY